MTFSFVRLPLLALFALILNGPAYATADGPDFFRVSGVATTDILNMRAGPSTEHTVVGRIPAEANGVMNFGCVGGLSFDAWQTASDEERAAAAKTRWCLVGYDRTIGWSAGWFLTEGSAPDALDAGARQSTLAGSEWQLRDLAGTPAMAEAWVNFSSDGTAFGDSGCNRFNGSYTVEPGQNLMGPTAMTRRACIGDQAETETAFMMALSKANRVVATHLLLALFEDDRLLATLTRRDPD